MIYLFRPYVSEQAKKNVIDVLNSGTLTQGRYCDNFEEVLQTYYNTNNVSLTNSCTSGLQLCYKYIKKWFSNDEQRIVLSSPLTCLLSHLGMCHEDFNPAWCDVNKSNLNINLDDVETKIDRSIAAIHITRWGGNSLDYDRLYDIKKRYEDKYNQTLFIVEDCAHLLYHNYIDFPSIKVFSGQAIKFCTGGDIGWIIAENEEQNKFFRKLRWAGLDRDNGEDFRSFQNVDDIGYKFNSNDVAASIALGNFNGALENVTKHQENAAFYDNYIRNEKVKLLPYDRYSNYWLYTLYVDDLEGFIDYMSRANIQVHQVHKRNDMYNIFWYHPLQNLNEIEDKYCCIPVGWWLSQDDKEYIVNTINKWK